MKKGKKKFVKPSANGAARISPAKRILFISIMAILPLLFLVLLEAGLRIFNYGGELPLFISIPDETSKYYGINTEVAKRYFTTLSDVPMPRKDLFLKVKPDNGYRIFILGESTAAGFPYGNNITFPRILNRRLSDAFPDKKIEIVNTGMTAINSYTQLDFLDEILQHQPDAILIYSGHNEYYGALGIGSTESIGQYRWLVKATFKLQKFKTYLLIRDLVTGIKDLFIDSEAEINKADDSATLMERIVKEQVIPLNSNNYESGKNQFKENISEIIQKAQEAGVKVIISELVSNVKDNKPFESVKSEGLPSASEIYKSAIEFEKQEKYEEAKKAYYFAKDLDALRFRAPEDFNNIIHETAAEFKIPVVPMKSYFESASPNRLIGDNLMHEHLHPNLDGYFLMADAFMNTLMQEKLISAEWQTDNINPSSFYRNNWGYTSLDSTYADFSVLQLKGGWPFKKQHGPNLALAHHKFLNKVDSVAAYVLTTGQMTLEQGHIELANYYESRGELEKAFREFNALIYTVPYLDLFYEPAAKLLIRMEEYDRAKEILLQSLKFQETAFAYQWIGQIHLVNNETAEGIEKLKRAVELGSRDLSLLFNLSRAYYNTGEWQQGDVFLNQLKNQPGSQSYVSNLEEFRRTALEKPK